MTGRTADHPAADREVVALTARPPRWLATLLGGTTPHPAAAEEPGIGAVTVRRQPELSFVEVTVPHATALGATAFQECVERVYLRTARLLADEGRYAIRFWSYVPDIHGAMGHGLDRYHAFNAGRYRAFASWYGTPQAFAEALPTASALGVEGETLTVHCLAAGHPGRPVENPRQIPSYRYSARYGPRPPCFARATQPAGTLGGQKILLVGGTASIVGEASQHVGDVAGQTRETLANLDALLEAAGGDGHEARPRFTDLRVYVVSSDAAAVVLGDIARLFPDVADVELARAKICRRELALEIEGVAAFDQGPGVKPDGVQG